MKFKVKHQTERLDELIGRRAKAIFTLINMGADTKQSGWWIYEEREGTIIYADTDKATIKTDKGVPMCFTWNEVRMV